MRKMLNPVRWMILLTLLMAGTGNLHAQTNGILFVKKGSTGQGNSWSDAIGELADALIAAKNNAAVKQIWVAGGKYTPMYSEYDNGQTYNDVRHRIFLLLDNVKMYGGFAGTESTLAERNLALDANRTILSGDIDKNDPPNGEIVGNNAYHILLMYKENGHCFLDGFTIQGGSADGDGNNGVNLGWATLGANLGGALVTIRVNTEITNCVFRGNKAKIVSAFFALRGNQTISNTLFVGNSSAEFGTVFFDESFAKMVNCTVSGNFSGVSNRPAIHSNGAIVNIYNSIIYGNNADIQGQMIIVRNSIVKDGFTGTNNSTADPLFMDMPSYTLAPFITGNYKCRPGSPALNTGKNSFTEYPLTENQLINAMADQLKGVNCIQPDCSVANPERMVANDNIDDFVDLSPAEFESVGNQNTWLDIGWTNQPVPDATWFGLIVSDEQGILSAENLPFISVEFLNTPPGAPTGTGFFGFQSFTFRGKAYKYLSGATITNSNRMRITVAKYNGSLNSIRIHGAFLMVPGLNQPLLTDVAGAPRIKDQWVDMGAYEGQQRLDQTIAVSNITKTFGDAAFKPGFTASSTLPLNYSSSNNSIAEAWQDAADNNAWKITIKKAGTVNFTVTQEGNDDYFAAPAQNFDLLINKAPQNITWTQTNLETGCEGVADIQLTAISNNSKPVIYTVANTNIAVVNGNLLTPVSGGATSITATLPGDENHEAAIAIEKAFKFHLTSGIRQHFSDLLMFDNSSGNYVQWQWYKNGAAIDGATKPYYTNATSMIGNYYVMATDKNGNTVQACPLAVTGNTVSGGIKVSPNPVKPGSTVAVTSHYNTVVLLGARLVVSNSSGTILQQVTTVNPVTQLQAPAASGLYIVTLILTNGQKVSANIWVK